jgi:hypothetical protein
MLRLVIIEKILVIPTVIVKSIEHVTKTKSQLIKLVRIHVRYPCIICSYAKHRSKKCPKKIEVQNMFRTKPINYCYNA